MKSYWLLIAACVCPFAAGAAEAPSPKSATSSSITHESGRVEAEIATRDGDARAFGYVVEWHGTRIFVSCPLATKSISSVGDTLSFEALHVDLGQQKILSFMKYDGTESEGKTSSGADPASSTASYTSASATIDEVLTANDQGYRFVAYLVKWNGGPTAITDPLARSAFSVGTPITFTLLKSRISGGDKLSTMLTSQSTSAETRGDGLVSNPIPDSIETSTVLEVLTDAKGEYRYRAYIANWRGSRIVVTDKDQSMPLQVGDRIIFTASRALIPDLNIKLLSFERSSSQVATTAAPSASNYKGSVEFTTGIVDEVLKADDDGFSATAYIVKRGDNRIAVSDAFGGTEYHTGDKISFPVSLGKDVATGRHSETFMIFQSSKHSAVKPQDCETPMAQATSTPKSGLSAQGSAPSNAH